MAEADDDAESSLSDLIARLQKAGRPPRPASKAPKRPTVIEATVDSSDIPIHQLFGQKVDSPDACNHEGWYWSPGYGVTGDIPFSIWCGRIKGHAGPHEARTGLSFHRHKIRVLQWTDGA